MDIQFSGFEIFAPKIEVAWTALQRQYARHLTGAGLDHLFACRACVGTKFRTERMSVRLHSALKQTQPWVADAESSGWGAHVRKYTISMMT
ncbi:hypothetical protein [Rhizobium sp. ZPR3]|uniref:Uncharacterized protein n=2 Tax=unclassified Rhizobium TaxID=2613769 RepID=A0AAU7SQ62_9HYPH